MQSVNDSLNASQTPKHRLKSNSIFKITQINLINQKDMKKIYEKDIY